MPIKLVSFYYIKRKKKRSNEPRVLWSFLKWIDLDRVLEYRFTTVNSKAMVAFNKTIPM